MTLAEVIDTLQTCIRNADDEYDREEMGRVAGLKEALHEIKKIEQSEDCISRQELKKMFREKCVADCSCCKYWRGDDWCEIFNELPPVQPKQKTGHWVELTELSCEEYSCYVCSECEAYAKDHSRRLRVQHYKSLFCPDCGLKMEVDK